jgi:hypothetical protein
MNIAARIIAVLGFGIALQFLSAAPAGKAEGLSWRRATGSVALVKQDQVIWNFRYNRNEAKPAFHPVALPGGPVLTCFRAEDHPWHRGLWFSWKFINGLNYWEEDKVTGASEGRTEWRNVRVTTRPDFSARISMELSYRPTNGQPVLAEQRVIEVSTPDAQGIYRLDWTMTFKALGKDVWLDRTPIPGEPEGKGHGGYAGLSVRFARELTNAQAVTSTGPVVFTNGTYRGKAAATDYSGTLENQEIGIAMVDHPGNLNAPSPWYIIDNKQMKYFSPAVLCYGRHTLKAGATMTLRYRVIAHPGRWNADRLRAQAERFASGRK